MAKCGVCNKRYKRSELIENHDENNQYLICKECAGEQCEHGYFIYPDNFLGDAIYCPECFEIEEEEKT